MNCDEALLAISAALDGELPPGERERLSRHLLECESCRALAEDLRVLTGELGRSDRPAPQSLAEAVRQAVAAEAKTTPVRKKRTPYLRAVAAMLALCAGLGGIGLFAAGRGGGENGSASGAAPAMLESAPWASGSSGEAAPEDGGLVGYSLDGAEPQTSMEAEGKGGGGPTSDAEQAPAPLPSSAPAATAADSGGNGEASLRSEKSDEYILFSSNPEEDDSPSSEAPSPAGVTADTAGSNVETAPADAPGGASGEESKTTPGSEGTDQYSPGSDSHEETAPGSDAVLTPEEALELVFQHLGGYEAYPEARQRMVCMYGFDAPAYYLKTVETDAVSSEYCLDYTGSPPEGEGYYFRFYEMVTDKREDGFDHTATSNWYTVSPDGEITAEFPELPVE